MTTAHIKFFDEDDKIGVFDGITDTTTYFNKDNLLVQMDSNDNLYLKNESNIGFYTFSNVVYPVVDNCQQLVVLLIKWANNREKKWDFQTATSMMDLKMRNDKNILEFDEKMVDGGSVTYELEEQAIVMQVSGLVTSRSIRQSKQYISYRMGQDILALVSGTLIEPDFSRGLTEKMRGVEGRIGLYEDTSDVNPQYPTPGRVGCFFSYEINGEQDVETVSIKLQYNNIIDVKNRGDWNMDKLDGTGRSRVTIDFRSPQIFVFDVQYSDRLVWKVGVLYSGNILYCHEFDRLTNTQIELNWDTFKFGSRIPIRWELAGFPEGAILPNGSMVQGNAIVYNKQSGISTDFHSFGICNETPKILQANDANHGLIALTLNDAGVRSRVQLSRIQLLNTQTGYARWELVLDPTKIDAISGLNIPAYDPTQFTSVNSLSIVNRSEEDTIITDGVVLASGYIASSDVTTIKIDDKLIAMMAKIDGTPDVLALRITGMYGTANVAASVQWRESA